jgi:hypothetical protein
MKDFLKGKPNFDDLYILNERGNKEEMDTPQRNWVSKEATKGILEIFDARNNTYSQNTIFKNSKGYYFKKRGKRYYLKDFLGDKA